MTELSRSVAGIDQGNGTASGDLLPLVYDELRRLATAKMSHEKPGQTLDATGLVHEAYLRLMGQSAPTQWQNHRHFLAAAAEAMRRILVERARQRTALKRGGRARRQPLEDLSVTTEQEPEELLTLSDALDRLQTADSQAAEIVKLRFFAGQTMEQAAEALGISERTAYYAWEYARAWLKHDIKTE